MSKISDFPYGCQYHRHPTPLNDEWEPDFAELANLGYTHVQFRPQWRCHERLRGEYDWRELDALFDTVEHFPLAVILKPQLENAPDWVFTELNGCRIGFNSTPFVPIAHAAFYVGGWWPCFTNSAVAAAASSFICQLVKRYRSRQSLWLYNAWNEPRSRPLGQCQCQYCLESYRNWLRQKHETIEDLNAAYGKAWSSFDTIMPPQSHSDYLELFLWRQWAAEQVAAQVALSARCIRKNDPNHPIMCHVGCSSLVQDPACDTSNDLLNAREVDFYGCSFPVQLHPKTSIEINQPLYQSAWLRRVDPNYFCHEFYPNNGNWCLEPSPVKLERQIWMAIASGARGFTFWQYRSERFGEESNGYGMREINGSPTERSQCCDRVGAAIKSFGEDFVASDFVRSRVAVWFDPRNDLLMRIEDMRAELNGNSGIASINANTDYSGKRAVEACYCILQKMGVTADFVIPDDKLSEYDLLVIPAVELIDDLSARQLADFVANGGTLLIEYPFACRDQRTWVAPFRPVFHLERLTGCQEGNRQIILDSLPVEFVSGTQAYAKGWKVKLKPLENTRVTGFWPDGSAATVEHPFGSGTVITSGANFALHFFDFPDTMTIPETYRRSFTLSGLAESSGNLLTVRRVSPKRSYTFVFNIDSIESEMILPEKAKVLYSVSGCCHQGNKLKIPADGTVVYAI